MRARRAAYKKYRNIARSTVTVADICDRLQEKGPFVTYNQILYLLTSRQRTTCSIIWYKQLHDRILRSQVTGGSVGSTGNQPIRDMMR